MLTNGTNISRIFKLLLNDDRFDFSSVATQLKQDIANNREKPEMMDIYFEHLKLLEGAKISFERISDFSGLRETYTKMKDNYGQYKSFGDVACLWALNSNQAPAFNDAQLLEVKKVLLTYTTISNLWTMANGHSANIALQSMLKYCVLNKITDYEPIKEVDIRIIDITRTRIGVSIEQIIDFVGMQGCNIDFNTLNVKPNVIMPSDEWLRYSISKTSEFAKKVVDWYVTTIEKEPIQAFVNTGNHNINVNTYYSKALQILLENGIYNHTHSQTIINLAKETLEYIKRNTPLSKLQKLILQNVEYSEVSSEFDSAFDILINTNGALNSDRFIALHKFIEETPFDGRSEKAAKFLNRSLDHIIANTEVQKILIENDIFYKNLIISHIQDASSIRTKIENYATGKTQASAEFKEWCQSIHNAIQ